MIKSVVEGLTVVGNAVGYRYVKSYAILEGAV